MTEKKANPAKRGRKPVPESLRHASQLTCRLSAIERAALADLAELYGLSLSATLERCLSIALETIQPADWQALAKIRERRADRIAANEVNSNE